MTKELNIGDKIPSFNRKDEEDNTITIDDVLGRGPLVIYFYPKDDTPGCTVEACSFRDQLSALASIKALVIGVSPDSVQSHQEFTRKYSLNFTLLSDLDKTMCRDYNVLKEEKIVRTTFVVNSKGIITWIECPVKIEGHVERVLEAVHACFGNSG